MFNKKVKDVNIDKFTQLKLQFFTPKSYFSKPNYFLRDHV